jgi:hypothetical protein
MNPVLAAGIAEALLITYRGSKQGKYASSPIPHVPLPSEYVAVFIIFGGLSFIGGNGQRPAALFGWGVVLATLLNLWDPTTVGNRGGVAVKGGPSTKNSTTPTVAPANLSPVNPNYKA